MKILLTLVFILALISTALAGVRIEAHNDHSHEEVSTHVHHGHTHKHSSHSEKKEADSKNECSHAHIHLNAICFGLILSPFNPLPGLSSTEKMQSYSNHELRSQEFVNSLYRPPIV